MKEARPLYRAFNYEKGHAMGRKSSEFSELKMSIRMSSSRHFGAWKSKFDVFLSAFLDVCVCALVGFSTRSQPPLNRCILTACAVICMHSVLSSCRMAVPFVLRISYADMLRIRRPFYIWLCCVFLAICLSDSFLALFSGRMLRLFKLC